VILESPAAVAQLAFRAVTSSDVSLFIFTTPDAVG